MLITVLRFFGLFLTALLVGTMFGIWLGFNPAALSAGAYVEMQQNTIRALNVILPALGMLCIVLTSALAAVTKGDRPGRLLLVLAALCLASAGLVTRFANQPINAVVMTWSAEAPPTHWTELRDAWWQLHKVRTALAVGGFALALFAAVRQRAGAVGSRRAA
jgi:hypothetical protein